MVRWLLVSGSGDAAAGGSGRRRRVVAARWSGGGPAGFGGSDVACMGEDIGRGSTPTIPEKYWGWGSCWRCSNGISNAAHQIVSICLDRTARTLFRPPTWVPILGLNGPGVQNLQTGPKSGGGLGEFGRSPHWRPTTSSSKNPG